MVNKVIIKSALEKGRCGYGYKPGTATVKAVVGGLASSTLHGAQSAGIYFFFSETAIL